jgi:hypothetical protein
MERLLGREIEMSEVEDKIIENFRSIFGYSSESPAVPRIQNADLAAFPQNI